MLCKYYLQLGSRTLDVGSAECIDVSSMIKNLDSIKVSYARTDLGGVVRKCGSEIEFTGKAYEAIVSFYQQNYLHSVGVFAVFMADNNWNYTKAWECPLDFSTLHYDSNVLSIGCVDNSVAAVIKANKKTKYEINVIDISDRETILYNGVLTKREGEFLMVSTALENPVQPAWDPNYFVPSDMIILHYDTNEEHKNGKDTYELIFPNVGISLKNFQSEKFTAYDQESARVCNQPSIERGIVNAGVGFIECLQTATIHITLSIRIKSNYSAINFFIASGSRIIHTQYIPSNNSGYGMMPFDGDVTLNFDGDIAMNAREKLSIGFHYDRSYVASWHFTQIVFSSNTNQFYSDESSHIDNPKYLESLSNTVLLNEILKKMFPETNGTLVRGVVEGNDLVNRTRLVAAETLRDITGQKFYTSFQQFCDYMESVFGFVYTIADSGMTQEEAMSETSGAYTSIVEIVFKHRSQIFTDATAKRLDTCNNLQYAISDDMIFSGIEVGYPVKDYDNDNNARNEYNFTNNYSTGVTLADNVLSLLCPYRADCYGVEELLIKTKNEEKNESDDDIFVVLCKAELNLGIREIDRSVTVENAYSDTVFNALLAPCIIVLNNKEYIAAFTSELKFASSDANSAAVIKGVAMNSDVPISGQLFRAGKISIDTDDHNFPENWEGVIEFDFAGKTYKGYLESIDINFANLGKITYNLIEKCIE